MEQVESRDPIRMLAETTKAVHEAFDAITKQVLDGEISPTEGVNRARELSASVRDILASARAGAAA